MKQSFTRVAFCRLAVLAVTGGLSLSILPAASAQSAGSSAHPLGPSGSLPAQAEPPAAMAAPSTEGERTPASPVWIDVRTPKEFNAGHLEGAHNVPVEQIEAQIAALVPDKDTPVLLYCRSGRRAEHARKLLLKQGYTQVGNRGGYAELLKQQKR